MSQQMYDTFIPKFKSIVINRRQDIERNLIAQVLDTFKIVLIQFLEQL